LARRAPSEFARHGGRSTRDFEAYVVEFFSGSIWSRPGLDSWTKSMVTVATLAAQGRVLGLELNIRMALNNGASRQDSVETLLPIAPYAGFSACWEGLALARKVFDEASRVGSRSRVEGGKCTRKC
jgi:4-carboxymuconolactone decarboxylase